jgi:Na+-translocating ferredoxin:NAD+ oxidoreductase subunit B
MEVIMSVEVYHKVAEVLNTLPNGFPPTESGVEIKLLKKIFNPDEAELFCKLKLNYETAEQIARRSGIPVEGLSEKLKSMWQRGQIESREEGGKRVFRMVPWVVGIYEFQLKRMDKEFAQLVEEYGPFFGPQLVMTRPQMMQVLPVEKDIPVNYEALPYERVSSLIENGQSFMVNDCICRKKNRLLGKGCDKPLEICMAIGDEPGLYDNHPMGGRLISKEEAYELLRKAEEAALVHLTGNVVNGQWYICNCCGCCDGQLEATRNGLYGIINSHFYAAIDPDLCSSCGVCADERCQVGAIAEVEDTYQVNRAICIGCGLCVSTCPSEAVKLFHKSPEELVSPARDEMDWFEKRANERGVDYSGYK